MAPPPRFDDGMLPLSFPFLTAAGLCAIAYVLSMLFNAK
jgi:hypothetical protein